MKDAYALRLLSFTMYALSEEQGHSKFPLMRTELKVSKAFKTATVSFELLLTMSCCLQVGGHRGSRGMLKSGSVLRRKATPLMNGLASAKC